MKHLQPLSIFQQILPASIKGKLTLWFLALSLVPVLAMGIFGYQNARGTLEKEITKALNAVADNKTFTLRKWSEDQLADVKNLAS